MNGKHSAIAQIMHRITIENIGKVIAEDVGMDKDQTNAVRALLALAWIEGAHMALWAPFAVAAILVNSEEVFDLVRDLFENLIDEYVMKASLELTSEQKAEEVAMMLAREKYRPITNLTKDREETSHITYFLKKN